MAFYTTSFQVPYFETVAGFIWQKLQEDPLKLADAVIVVPSPRMAMGLKLALANISGGALVLPNIRTLSFAEDDLDILRFEDELPAGTVSPLARLMVLSQLVRAKSQDLPYKKILEDAWYLGEAFSRFSAYEITLDDIQAVLPDELSAAWAENLEFLKIACDLYPKWLAEEEKIDATVASQQLMRELVMRNYSATEHIFAVGFNDTTPVGQKVLQDIAMQGDIIFPPFENLQNEHIPYAQIHPLYGVQKLMDILGVEDLHVLGKEESSPFFAKQVNPSDVAHISLIEAQNTQLEADSIAMLMRDILQTPGKTCAVIAPDRTLASRIVASLRYWDVDVDDSAGQPLNTTPFGSWVTTLLNMLLQRFDPMLLAAFFSNVCCMRPEGYHAFETHVLRGVAPAYGLYGLKQKLAQSRANEEEHQACETLLEKLFQSTESLTQNKKHDVRTWAENLLKTLAHWSIEAEGEDTATFMDVLNRMVAESNYMQQMDFASFVQVLEKLMESAVVRRRYGKHPRLFVWGPMEARLQTVDRVIIAGLNEGAWPRKVKADPWLNRQMNNQLGLLDPEVYIGLSAYDFITLSHAKEVFWTRTISDSEGETVASRFVVEAENKFGEQLWQNLKSRGNAWLNRSLMLRHEGESFEPKRPHVETDVRKRPNTWSPSLLGKYMQCPYQVFADKILKIQRVENFAEDPSAADKGQLIHLCLEAMVQQVEGMPAPYVGNWQDADAVERYLLTIGEVAFGALQHEGRKAVWWQKFKRIAKGFALEMQSLQSRNIYAVEKTFKAELAEGIQLKARMDRVDNAKAGGLYLIDYKTGNIPSWKQVETGEAPQMAVEAVLAAMNGYNIAGLEYWSVKGERTANVVRKVYKEDLEDLQNQTKDGLESLTKTLTQEDFAYEAVPGSINPNDPKGACLSCDYAGLCRFKDFLKEGSI